MEIIINHEAKKIHTALGVKEDHLDFVMKSVQSYFMNETADGPGHGKTSICLEEAISKAKKLVFNDVGPIQEYEATLMYLGYIIGAEIAAHKERISGMRNPLTSILGELLKRGNLGHPSEAEPRAFHVKCDSQEEVDLHRSVMEHLSNGNMGAALAAMMKLKDIKDNKF